MDERKLIVCYFANANNYHTIKWAKYFANAGFEVHVLSLEACDSGEMLSVPDVTVHWLRNNGVRLGTDLQKVRYAAAVRQARALLADISPDIVHAHYASSYGVVCALSCRTPYYLSLWGSDVYEFPQKSLFHRALIKYSLRKCRWLLSTSAAMAREASKYTDKQVQVTPFGVDIELFSPKAVSHDRSPGRFVVGTVKSLERKYGIGNLLLACNAIRNDRPDLDLQLRIAGKGTMEGDLKALSRDLGLDRCVVWLGFISQEEAAREWAGFDVAVVGSVSESESFGVSAVEAQACGTPLVITDIPGLMEACDDGRTAYVVPRGDWRSLADAIVELADDPGRRVTAGIRGRAYVSATYEMNNCFERVRAIYERGLAE